MGIRNAIIQNTNSLYFRDDLGALWENFCISERMKFMNYNQPLIYQSYFWRTYNQNEIDYIEEREGLFHAFEYKWSPRKQPKLPDDFDKTYPGTDFKIITPENFTTEIYELLVCLRWPEYTIMSFDYYPFSTGRLL